jgi:CRISPR-associated protein Cmr4
MFEAKSMLYLYVETPLHAGSGASLGVVDLPVQRERVTGYPMVQASGIKGKLRAEAYLWDTFVKLKDSYFQPELTLVNQEVKWQTRSQKDREQEAEKRARKKAAKELGLEIVFGPETDDASEHAGAFTPSDARLLLFPVRSLLGVFAWTTSRDALARFFRDATIAGISLGNASPDKLAAIQDKDKADSTALVAPGNDVTADKKLVLEEFAFDTQEDSQVGIIADWLAANVLSASAEYDYWRKKLARSLVVLPQSAFQDFTRFSVEVINRVKLASKTKTAVEGALWSEEHLPTDTLLYTPLFATKPRAPENKTKLKDGKDVLDFVKNLGLDRVQLGGDETVGRGLVKLRFN